jgi:hypothetical protein
MRPSSMPGRRPILGSAGRGHVGAGLRSLGRAIEGSGLSTSSAAATCVCPRLMKLGLALDLLASALLTLYGLLWVRFVLG